MSNNTNVDSRVSDVQLEMLKERLSTCNSDDAASQMFPLFESLRKRAAVVQWRTAAGVTQCWGGQVKPPLPGERPPANSLRLHTFLRLISEGR